MSAPDEPVCPECGGELRWGEEYKGIGATPCTTGYEVLFCQACDHVVERRWVGP